MAAKAANFVLQYETFMGLSFDLGLWMVPSKRGYKAKDGERVEVRLANVIRLERRIRSQPLGVEGGGRCLAAGFFHKQLAEAFQDILALLVNLINKFFFINYFHLNCHWLNLLMFEIVENDLSHLL